MTDTANDKEFILALLEERDKLYQHNARLQSKLDELESADVEIASCKQTIEEQKLIIEKKRPKDWATGVSASISEKKIRW